jgi:Putative adhesin
MSHTHIAARLGPHLIAGALAVLVLPWSIAHAATQIAEHRPADPQGSVDIVNVAGSIDIQGWDKSEVDVTGTAGKNVERVEVSGDGNRTSINVQLRSRGNWASGTDGEANLIIHVPAASSITTSLVSADLKVSGLKGDVKLQTVSGNVSGDVGGDVHANNVSGNIALAAPGAKVIEVRTVSGDIALSGGDADVEVTSVSGDGKITLKTPSRARFQSVSGELSVNLAVGPDAQIDAQSVSGDVNLEFSSAPAADFDIQSFSGDIENCFGPTPTKPQHGPGSRLTFKTGDSRARVRVSTKSGSVQLCAKGESRDRGAKKP